MIINMHDIVFIAKPPTGVQPHIAILYMYYVAMYE